MKHYTTQFPTDLVAFTEVIFNGKLHFLCSETYVSLPLGCSNLKRSLVPALIKEMIPQNRQNKYEFCFVIGEISSQRFKEFELLG